VVWLGLDHDIYGKIGTMIRFLFCFVFYVSFLKILINNYYVQGATLIFRILLNFVPEKKNAKCLPLTENRRNTTPSKTYST